jgi:hypothetical protein
MESWAAHLSQHSTIRKEIFTERNLQATRVLKPYRRPAKT